LVVGMRNESYIAKHRRLQEYDAIDFRLLREAVAHRNLLLVPHVAAETSNLLRQVGEPIRTDLTAYFGELLLALQEHYLPSKGCVTLPFYRELGLTDTLMLKLMKDEGVSLLTVDLDLYLAAAQSGL